jgi:Bacterial PH domain
MPTYEEILDQIKSLPHRYIFYTGREIKALPKIMIEGEEVRALTSGYHGKRTVLAVCTNRRIIFLDKGMFFGMRQWQIALDRVQSIDGNYLIVFGTIRVWDGAAPIEMSMVWARTIDPFIKAVRQAIDDFKRLSFQELSRGTEINSAGQSLDVATQLEKLIQLKQAGHLSEDEFMRQRSKLLG